MIVAPALAVRAGLRAILKAAGDFEIVSEAARLADLKPTSGAGRICFCCSRMGMQLAPKIWSLPEAAVLLLSDDPAQAGVLSAGPWRAWGILPTDCSEDELLAALYALDAGAVGCPVLICWPGSSPPA